MTVIKEELVENFKELRQRTAGIQANQVVQKDGTPCYIDMAKDSILSFRGFKTVDDTDTVSKSGSMPEFSGKVLDEQRVR
uniref:Uncharacterized protein n=1 Tax=Plectus sambesii TaxID=2011161 RepID=A0A914WFW1_9BILA